MAEFWENDPIEGGTATADWWANDPVDDGPAPAPRTKLAGVANVSTVEGNASEIAGDAIPEMGWLGRTAYQTVTGIDSTITGIGQTALAALAPALGPNSSIISPHFEQAALDTARNQQGIEGAVARQQDSKIGAAATNVISSLGKVLASAPTGFGGMLASQYYDSVMANKLEALDAGKSDSEANTYAMLNAAPEAAITTVFQAFGMGGLEKTILNGAKWQGFKGLLKGLGQELTEEQLITLSDAFGSQVAGVDPDAFKKYPQRAIDTAIQVVGTMGLVGAYSKGRNKYQQFVDNPSRRTARDAGLDKIAPTQRERVKLAEGVKAAAEAPASEPAVDPDYQGIEEGALDDLVAETSPPAPTTTPPHAESTPPTPTSPVDATLPETAPEPPQPAEVPPDASGLTESQAEPGLAAKNESTARLRERMQLSQLPSAERKKWEVSLAEAFDRGIPEKANDLAAAVVANPRQLDDAEHAGMTAKLVDLNDQYDAALAAYDSIPDGTDNSTEAATLQRIEQETDLITNALKKGGTEWGRAGAIRQMELGRDYSILGLKRRAKASKKGDLTPEEKSAVESDAKKIAAKEKQIDRKQKQRKHREVARIKSAIGKVRRTLGLDEADPKSLEIPGLSEKDNAELNTLREKLREAQAAAVAADTIMPDGKVHNRPSEEIVAELDDAIGRVQAILKEKAAPPDSSTVEMRRRLALEKQLEKARKDLSDARRGVAIERRHGPELEIINDLRNQLSAAMGETAAIEQLEANIAEVERRLAEGDFSTRGKKHGPDNETVSTLKAKLADLRKEYDAKNPADIKAALDKLYELQSHLENGTLPEAKVARGVSKPELQVVRDAIAMTRKAINRSPRAVKKRLRQSIADLHRRLNENDFAAPTKKERNFFDDEHDELLRELSDLKQRARRRVADLRPQNPIKKAALRISNTLKAFVTSGDFPPIFRQGGILTAANPALGYRGAKVGMRAMLNERTAFLLERHLNEYGARYDRAGLELPETFGEPTDREESFMGSYTDNIPVVKQFVGASERNFNASMNYMRTQAFDALAEKLPRNGEATLAELQDIARYVNIASGRGDFSPETQQKLASISAYFFSPRYVLSRFQYLIGTPLWKASSGTTRKLIAKEYAKTFAGMALLYSLAQAAGALWEKDPRSSDSLKLVLGDTRMDFGAGLGQTATVTARAGDAIYRTLESLVTGDERRESEFKDDRNVYNDFLRQKFSPTMALFWDTSVGQSVVHDPLTKTEVAKAFVPISFRDVFTEMKAQGVPKGTALFMLSLFGAGMNTYEPKANIPALLRTARSRPKTEAGRKRKLAAIKKLQGE